MSGKTESGKKRGPYAPRKAPSAIARTVHPLMKPQAVSEGDPTVDPLYSLAAALFRRKKPETHKVYKDGEPIHLHVHGLIGELMTEKGGKDPLRTLRVRYRDFEWESLPANESRSDEALSFIEKSGIFWLVKGVWIKATLEGFTMPEETVAFPGSPEVDYRPFCTGDTKLAEFLKKRLQAIAKFDL